MEEGVDVGAPAVREEPGSSPTRLPPGNKAATPTDSGVDDVKVKTDTDVVPGGATTTKTTSRGARQGKKEKKGGSKDAKNDPQHQNKMPEKHITIDEETTKNEEPEMESTEIDEDEEECCGEERDATGLMWMTSDPEEEATVTPTCTFCFVCFYIVR